MANLRDIDFPAFCMEVSIPANTLVVSSRHLEATQMSNGQESHLISHSSPEI
jgi:hypothetical protein